MQFDLGKRTTDGFERTGQLNCPPPALLTALATLKSGHIFGGSDKVATYVKEVRDKYPRKADQLIYNASEDRLFQAGYDHPDQNRSCEGCDESNLMSRKARSDENPEIHYGTIASSNQVMKHGGVRDRVRDQFDALCFEMEAAGLMKHFPCIAIRGICDYSDSHKNDRWQLYAATVATAYAKELLEVVSLASASETSLATEICEVG